jgi:alpha-galactosidase
MSYRITVIGGGSSTFTPQLMQKFMASEVLRGSTVVLMDIDSSRLETMGTLCRLLVQHECADLIIETSMDQRESLRAADFVITAISVGGFDAWEKDIEIPAKHGVYMPVEDSIGPGGIMRAFRHIPHLAAVCRDLEDVSPNARVFNYTNPATSICIAQRRVLSDASNVEVVSLCVGSPIPANAEYLAGLAGVEPNELAMPAPAGGLNHCAAILDLRLKDGQDALAMIRERTSARVIRWGLENFGVLPYCYYDHWPEFFPSLCRMKDRYEGRLQGLNMEGFSVMDMEKERERAAEWDEVVERLARGREEISTDVLPKDESVQVVRIIEALVENRNEVHVVNIPNCGAIDNLPHDAVVEVSALVNRYGIHPLHVGALPEPLAAVLRRHITVQELTAEAALTGDRHLALQAFLLDPQVAAVLTPEATRVLLDELLEAHAEYLPAFQ